MAQEKAQQHPTHWVVVCGQVALYLEVAAHLCAQLSALIVDQGLDELLILHGQQYIYSENNKFARERAMAATSRPKRGQTKKAEWNLEQRHACVHHVRLC